MVADVTRRSLVLAGGGMRVAYQAGVIRALTDAGLSFEHADGTSGGTINLAMLLSGVNPADMCDRWRALDVTKFVSLPALDRYLHGPDILAWGDASGVRDHVFPSLGIDIEAIRTSNALAGTFNVCNFSRKVVETIPHQAMTVDLLVAGISLPIFMPPVNINGAWYTDAVWITDANVAEAVRRGADEIWLVWCIGNTTEYYAGTFHQYVHMIEMSAAGALNAQLAAIAQRNASSAQPVVVHVIKPEFPLPLDPDFYLGRITADTLVDSGYSDAARYLATMTPGGVPLTPEVTQMRVPPPSVTFREQMQGPVRLNGANPATLVMRASIIVRDIERFVADPSHTGTIVGDIDFAPIGMRMPASRGAFNLFSPTDQPDLKLMIYELGFRHDGRRYYLAGEKRVRQGPVTDLWRETTTLYVTLHEGDDAKGPVIGDGTLRLGVGDLAKLATTMHALDAGGIGGSAAAVARFGEFFMGELWKTYGPGHHG